MPSEGDNILFALTKWRSCSWDQFRRAVDALYSRAVAEDGEHSIADLRWTVARQLEALGHCDLLEVEQKLLVECARPALARLPRAGLPIAVLCGARSDQTVREVREAARSQGGVAVTADGGSDQWWAPPTVITLTAETVEDLASVAERLAVVLPDGYPAWDIAATSASVRGYIESLHWEAGAAPDWPTRVFHADQVRWTDGAGLVGGSRLSRYRHPTTGQYQFWLWRNDQEYARVDPDWARYAVLAERSRSVLEWNSETGDVSHPAGAPLPVLLARALTLCSGVAPSHATREDLGIVRNIRRYSRVPLSIVQAVAEKLGQEVVQ